MKKIISIVILLTVLLSFATIVNAESFSLLVTPSKTTLKPGDEVELTLKVANISVGENGINTIEAKLLYDESIFEKVTQEDITSLNNWSITYNGEESSSKGKMLAIILSAGVKNDQEIGKIKLKVKANLQNSTSTKQADINIVNIATNNGISLINESDKNIPITIQFDNVTPTNENNNSNSNSNSNNSSNNENKQNNVSELVKKGDSTTASGSVPQTGTNEIIFIAIGIVLVLLGTISFIGYKRYRI